MQFITELNIEIKTNDRTVLKPFELDIYIQSRKLAIEFDGLYWHSENESKDPTYHYVRHQNAKNAGFSLFIYLKTNGKTNRTQLNQDLETCLAYMIKRYMRENVQLKKQI